MTTKETSLEFVERMEANRRKDPTIALTFAEIDELLRLAKTAALIEEQHLQILPNLYGRWWTVKSLDEQLCIAFCESSPDLHTAVRAVADKIKEQA